MSTIALRHYDVTVGYCTSLRDRKMRLFHKSLRLQLSRRRFRHHLRSALHSLNLV
ncbi:MAG: hypothetical protein NUV56_01235 [Candidatus Uhrbacteria bacterium]|nr:hypothetical protein [Candidatus Uhrbacteria bacterium]